MRSVTDLVIGMVPREERETKPSEVAGHTPRKKEPMERPLSFSSTG